MSIDRPLASFLALSVDSSDNGETVNVFPRESFADVGVEFVDSDFPNVFDLDPPKENALPNGLFEEISSVERNSESCFFFCDNLACLVSISFL